MIDDYIVENKLCPMEYWTTPTKTDNYNLRMTHRGKRMTHRGKRMTHRGKRTTHSRKSMTHKHKRKVEKKIMRRKMNLSW
jgi:hypothetical protein